MECGSPLVQTFWLPGLGAGPLRGLGFGACHTPPVSGGAMSVLSWEVLPILFFSPTWTLEGIWQMTGVTTESIFDIFSCFRFSLFVSE